MDRFSSKWLTVLTWILVITGGTVGLVSLTWHPSHDAPVVLYPAYLAWNGIRTPYSGIYDFNFPGTYVIYGFLGWITHLTDWGLQAIDLLLLGGGGVLVVSASPKDTWRQALSGYCCFSCVYLGWYADFGLQREFFCMLLAMAACTSAVRVGHFWVLGLLAGISILIKPTSTVTFVWIISWALAEQPNWRQRGKSTFQVVTGATIPVLASILWLLMVGAFRDFVAITWTYSPLYLAMDGSHSVLTRTQHTTYDLYHLIVPDYGVLLLAIAIAFMICLNWPVIRGRRDLRKFIVLMTGVTACFYIYPAFSGQFWRYHYLPFFAFGLTTLALLIRVDVETQLGQNRRLGGVVVATVVLFYFARGALYVLQPGSQGPSGIVASQVSRYLSQRLRPGDLVQPLDWTGGTVAGMLQCRAPLATSFLYDFEFYHHVSNPVIRALRSRFIRELNSSQPRYILQRTGEDKPWPKGSDTSREFPELARLLERNYEVVAEYPSLKIFERRNPASRVLRP